MLSHRNNQNSFSYTRLSLFAKCPRAYQFKYVLEEEERFSTVEQHMGGAVHAALEYAYKNRSGRQAPPLASVLQAYSDAWSNAELASVKVIKAGTRAPDYYNEGAHMIGLFYERVLRLDTSDTIELEREFEIALNAAIAYRGVIDRISRQPNGLVRITDYKTGKMIPDPSDDLQLASYALWFFHEYREDEIELCYEDLRNQRTPTARVRRSRASAVMAQLLSNIETILEGEDFDPNPSILCAWCGFNQICGDAQAYPGGVGRRESREEEDESDDPAVCPRCGGELEERHGRNGSFIRCMEFPECRYTRDDW